MFLNYYHERRALESHQEGKSYFPFDPVWVLQSVIKVGFRWSVRTNRMNMNSSINSYSAQSKIFTSTWAEFFKNKISSYPQDLPEIILLLALICTIGGRCNFFCFSLFLGWVCKCHYIEFFKSSSSRKSEFWS